MKTSPRSIKLASSLHEFFAKSLVQNFSPQEFGLITVTEVEVSGDLGVANIYIKSIGQDSRKIIKELFKQKNKFSAEISRQFKLRRLIILRFRAGKDLFILNN